VGTELHCHLNNITLDMAFITKTWLHSSTPDSVVNSDSNFLLFPKDRPSDGEGGGLVVCAF